MSYDVNELSAVLFSDDQIKSIYNLVKRIKSKDKKFALLELAEVLGTKPKRPLYYIEFEIRQLPRYGTRNIIRFSGDFIDQLVKFALEDFKEKESFWIRKPLGANLGRIQKYMDPDLYNELNLFNNIYVRAKHEFNHHIDKSLFDYIDAVFMIYITKNLSEKILSLSEKARDYANGGPTGYRYNPVYKR